MSFIIWRMFVRNSEIREMSPVSIKKIFQQPLRKQVVERAAKLFENSICNSRTYRGKIRFLFIYSFWEWGCICVPGTERERRLYYLVTKESFFANTCTHPRVSVVLCVHSQNGQGRKKWFAMLQSWICLYKKSSLCEQVT